MSEVRAAQRRASRTSRAQLDSMAAASRRLERQTEDLGAGAAAAPAPRADADEEALSFEQAKQAEAVAKSSRSSSGRPRSCKQSLEALRKSAEAAGLGDSAWQRQLAEIREQLERALSPELRERLAELQQALKDLDAERGQEALKRLAEAQQELREALERSRELFKRAALEGDLANLEQESRELAREQQEWNQQVTSADSARAAAAERELAERADSLAAGLDRARHSRWRRGEAAAARPAARKAGQAAASR